MTSRREKVISGARADASEGDASHGLCSRCMVFQPGSEYDLHSSEDRVELKVMIAKELLGGVVWEGDYIIDRSAKETQLYNELLEEVRRELGEGSEGNRL